MATTKPQKTDAQRQLDEIFASLSGYSKGAPYISTLSESSITAPAGSSSTPRIDPVAFRAPSKTPVNGMAMAPSIMSIAAALTKNPEMAQAAGLLGLMNRATAPDATIQSVAPSFLSQAARFTNTPVLGQIATVLGVAQNGLSVPGAMSLLGLVNPAIGLAGLVNSIAGNPIGSIADSIRNNVVSNPNSINNLASAGVSIPSQAYNSVNNNQVNNMDTETMDRFTASLSGPDNESESNRGSGNGSGSGNSQGSSSAEGTGNTSTSGANASRTGGDNRNSY